VLTKCGHIRRQALRGKDASQINLPVDLARPTALKPLLQLLTCGDAKVQVLAWRCARPARVISLRWDPARRPSSPQLGCDKAGG